MSSSNYPISTRTTAINAGLTDWRYLLVALGALILTTLAFSRGLTGPLVLDDDNNLAPLIDYQSGQRSAMNVIAGNQSGDIGRAVAMATFVANAATTGGSVYAFKATNLAIHLVAGVLLMLLLRRLLARDPRLAARSPLLAIALAAVWLLSPMQVSTVLYVVQRMAQLSALFALAALLAYVAGRERIEQGRRGGNWLLFCAFPLMTLLATFSKENGVLTPFLAGILEWTLFAPVSGRRPRTIRAWIICFLAIPAVLGAAVFAWKHAGLLSYAGRDFTLDQRLMTEARALWSYVGNWIFPIGARLGVFHDDYQVSLGLLSPASTLVALLAWAAVIVLAIAARRRIPLLSAGVLFFLCGHLLESTLLPLELYFEHRNYLPSVGLLLAATGLINWLIQRLPDPTQGFQRIGALLLAALLLTFAGATWVQSSIWGDPFMFWIQQAASHPKSIRVRTELASRAIDAGNLQEALHQIDLIDPLMSSRNRMMPPLRRVLFYCHANQPVPEATFLALDDAANGPISDYAIQVWPAVVNMIESGRCPAVDANRLADITKAWVAQAPDQKSKNVWLARFSLSLLLASQSRFAEAEVEGRRAWEDSNHFARFGLFLYQLEGTLGNAQAQRKVLNELKQHAGKGDTYVDQAAAAFQQASQ